MAYVITDECVSCGTCAGECPVEAISEGDGKYVIDAEGMPMSVLKAEHMFERVIAIKYDVPNDNLQMLDFYHQEIDDFYQRVLEKNA